MLILRMFSGLFAGAWGLARPGRREKNRVAAPGLVSETAVWIATTGSTDPHDPGAPYLGAAADFHARAARKAVVALDGEGVLTHMRHFRRYSSILLRTATPFETSPHRRPGTRCEGCGSTCARRDMSPATATCFACDPSHRRSRPSWTARDGRRIPVREMDESHLVNSARMVRRWLRDGTHPVSDDRIRMCGHVLVECARRGVMGEVRDG